MSTTSIFLTYNIIVLKNQFSRQTPAVDAITPFGVMTHAELHFVS